MLLANMAKHDDIERLLTLERTQPSDYPTSPLAINQLLDLFVRSADGAFNSSANLDYLGYLFADLAKFPAGASYILTRQSHDDLHPLSKLLPFTTHGSVIRRQGTSATTKNVAFAKLDTHATLLRPPLDVLPFVLRPLASGKDAYKPEEEEQLPEELQLLDDDCKRDEDHLVLRTHLDTLLVLTGSREGRDLLRQKGVYYIIRECHLAVDDDEVRDGCDRLVQVLMRDEEEEAQPPNGALNSADAPEKLLLKETGGRKDSEREKDAESVNEDDEVVEIAL
jgi:hypothetical protein